MNRFAKSHKALLVLVLLCTMTITACTMSQFNAVLNEIGPAITTILEIIAVVHGVPVNLSIATKVSADVAGIEKLNSDLQSAASIARPGIEADIEVGFTVLNNDLSTVFALAHVSDANTQLKINALIGLVETGVRIAEAAIPSPVGKVKVTVPTKLTASDLVDAYNKILVAKTGNAAVDAFTPKHKLHLHNKVARLATVGLVK